MPTGVALRDPRAQLIAAAERVLGRDGPGALTSRAVTDEAGVAKGVLHRHFADVEDLVVELVAERNAATERRSEELRESAGTGTVVGHVSRALAEAIDPVTVGLIGLAISRDGLRARLKEGGYTGLPTLPESTEMLAAYLAAERDLGRLAADADPRTLALNLVGTGHLLVAGGLGAPADAEALAEAAATGLERVVVD